MSLLDLPRTRLADLPTPLHEAHGLSRVLNGPRILIKRDDMTGLAFGGNKTRKLEYLMAAALESGADSIVAAGAYQSNMVRLTAAAARKAGLDPVLVLTGTPGEDRAAQGNILLDRLLGAELHFVVRDDRWDVDASVKEVVSQLVRRGRKPYTIPLGGATPLGTASYVSAALELQQQLWQSGLSARHVVLATGTGGTQAGLELGAHLLGREWTTVGISVSRQRDVARAKVRSLIDATADLIGVRGPDDPDVTVLDDYVGPGYGDISEAAADAIRLVARVEGIFLDPVYTGKAMAGMMDLIHKGYFSKNDTIVFLHTGGLPALFAQRHHSVLKPDVTNSDHIDGVAPKDGHHAPD